MAFVFLKKTPKIALDRGDERDALV